jgi:hypothetical protein
VIRIIRVFTEAYGRGRALEISWRKSVPKIDAFDMIIDGVTVGAYPT